MNRRRLRGLDLGLLSICLGIYANCLTFGQDPPKDGAPNSGAEAQLRLSTSRTEFHSGEVMPLTLSFTSATPDRYQINLAQYDRSGRMSYERFLLDPTDGTSDPLSLYFNSAWGFLGGGLTGFKFLSSAPITIHLDLNEWVRFDQPGKYQLTVVSRRVNDTHAEDNTRTKSIELRSDPIELHITVADNAWQHLEFKRILEGLGQNGTPVGNAPNDPKRAAWKALRYLGSEEAARELARRLRGEDGRTDWDCMFGLIGSPHREAGLEEMNKLLRHPDFPVSGIFITTMSILPLDATAHPELLRKQRDENRTGLLQRLVSALPRKRGTALALNLDTAMGGQGTNMPAELKSTFVPKLIESFPLLPLDRQLVWLQARWPKVSDPRWLPLLRDLVRHYEDFPQLREMHAYQSLQLSAAALTRWYELDPVGARDAVITEITRPKPRYGATVLGILPDETLPEVEHVIAEHLLATDDYDIASNLASLLFRYGDRTVLPQVLREFDKKKGNWAGDEQFQLLAYLLRVDPETAKPLVERAAAARCLPDSSCYYTILTTLGDLQNRPILEELALKSLWDPDPSAAIDAVSYLGKHGSPNAEQALWKRYEAWSREWAGRHAELRFVESRENPHVWDANLGQSLARALARGTAWLADETTLRRIQARGVGTNIQQDTEQALQACLKRPFAISYVATTPPSLTVAQYDQLSLELLKKKLAQFPTGTKFVFPFSGLTPSPAEQKVREEIFQFAKKNGITVSCASGS